MTQMGRSGPRPALVAWATLALAACSSNGVDPKPSVDGNEPAPAVASTVASQAGTSGAVVDWDGDGIDDLVVGAPFAPRADGGVGVILVHRGTPTGFERDAGWTVGGGDNFGSAVALAGDVDGDGKQDLAVAAVNGDGFGGAEASLSGNVVVLGGGSKGKVLARLAGEAALDKFGVSLTGGCDLDADGHPDLVVGATHHSHAPELWLGGAYYVYFGPTFAKAARRELPATETLGILGFSSACGDLNGDGVDDLALSAIWTHGVIWHESAVLVYYGEPGFAPETGAPDVKIQMAYLSAAAGRGDAHFGDALAVVPDLDGDGFNELAIGLPALYAIPWPTSANAAQTASLRGRVFVVRGGAGPRTVTFPLVPSRGDPGRNLMAVVSGGEYLERFGAVVAPLGDVDGGGKPDLAVAALHGSAPGASGLAGGKVTGVVRIVPGESLFDPSQPATTVAVVQAAGARTLARAEPSLHYGSFLAPFQRGGPRLVVGAPTASRLNGTWFDEPLTPSAP